MTDGLGPSNGFGPARRRLVWSGVVFALAFPTLITWSYFVYAQRFSTGVQQAIYLVVKTIQFVFPIVWVLLVLREPLATRRPTVRGMWLGAAFSVVVVGGGWIVFNEYLRDTPAFIAAAAKIRARLALIGIDTRWKYVLLGVFYSLVHSLLEEYYWRWFAFGQLRRLVRMWPAVMLSALAFMAHHVVILGQFFQDQPWLGWLFSAAVAVGGVFWAWLYDRSGSLAAPWLSHLLIDAGIFWVGYDLLGGSLTLSH